MADPGAQTSETARVLLERIVHFAGERPEAELTVLRGNVARLLTDRADEVDGLLFRMQTTGETFSYFPPEPLARAIHATVADVALGPDSSLEGKQELEKTRGRPILFVPNHLSYSDANVFAALLQRDGYADIAERLTVIAGPKVYSDPMRRFSSLCFGTIKTPQSNAVSTEEAVMSAREVARLARETIALARERQTLGDALLVFAEGTRSRTGEMQPTLAAASRYVEGADALVVPVGITGSERFIPVDDERIHPTRVVCRIGKPAEATALMAACDGNRRLVMDVIGLAIARQLPPKYRGAYGDDVEELGQARDIVKKLFG